MVWCGCRWPWRPVCGWMGANRTTITTLPRVVLFIHKTRKLLQKQSNLRLAVKRRENARKLATSETTHLNCQNRQRLDKYQLWQRRFWVMNLPQQMLKKCVCVPISVDVWGAGLNQTMPETKTSPFRILRIVRQEFASKFNWNNVQKSTCVAPSSWY